MKKIISVICIVCIILLMPTNVHAVERELNTSYTYLGNDIYIETIIEENISLFSTQTKSCSKTLNFKNSGNILFSIKVSGTFTYTGSSSTCTSSSVTTSVTDSAWKIMSKSASKSGNIAIGYATAKRYMFGFVVETRNETATLTCSATGVLS